MTFLRLTSEKTWFSDRSISLALSPETCLQKYSQTVFCFLRERAFLSVNSFIQCFEISKFGFEFLTKSRENVLSLRFTLIRVIHFYSKCIENIPLLTRELRFGCRYIASIMRWNTCHRVFLFDWKKKTFLTKWTACYNNHQQQLRRIPVRCKYAAQIKNTGLSHEQNSVR